MVKWSNSSLVLSHKSTRSSMAMIMTKSRFGLQDAKSSKSPIDTGFVTTKDSSVPFHDTTTYRSLVRALLYVAVCARPDDALSVSILGRKVCSPTEADCRVLRYHKCTKGARLEYSSDT